MILKNKNNDFISHLINENIPFSRVLLINGDKKEIITRQEALSEAQKLELDLFCVAPNASPPVCKLVDYQKYLFELSKQKKSKKKNVCKEITVSFNIEENDLKVKLKKVNEFVESGSMVKFNL